MVDLQFRSLNKIIRLIIVCSVFHERECSIYKDIYLEHISEHSKCANNPIDTIHWEIIDTIHWEIRQKAPKIPSQKLSLNSNIPIGHLINSF